MWDVEVCTNHVRSLTKSSESRDRSWGNLFEEGLLDLNRVLQNSRVGKCLTRRRNPPRSFRASARMPSPHTLQDNAREQDTHVLEADNRKLLSFNQAHYQNGSLPPKFPFIYNGTITMVQEDGSVVPGNNLAYLALFESSRAHQSIHLDVYGRLICTRDPSLHLMTMRPDMAGQ